MEVKNKTTDSTKKCRKPIDTAIQNAIITHIDNTNGERT